MRIGFITGEYPPMQGGVGAYTQVLAETLAAQGHDPFVLTDITAGEHDHPIPVRGGVATWGLTGLREARRWSRAHKLDVVNLQFQTAAFRMSPYVHFLPEVLRPLPVVTTFHDLRVPYLFPKAGALREWIVQRLARSSAGVIATNDDDYTRLSDHRHAARIPIGSNIRAELPADFDATAWRRDHLLDADEYLIAYFGLINHSKGVDLLITSLAALRREGIPARVVIVGGGAGSSDPTNRAAVHEIELLIVQSGMSPFVLQTGFIEDDKVARWLAAADVIALPFRDGASYRRGSLMAALHYGGAILTTTPENATPAFEHSANLWLTEPNTDALTDALRHLHTQPDARLKLRAGARDLSREFSWDAIARATAALYQAVIAG